MAYGDMSLWDIPGVEMPPGLQDIIEGYEGVDMTSRWEGTKAEKDALRRRGINPKYFNPRLAGAFKGFEFTGDFGQDLKRLNQTYTQAGGQNMGGAAKSPTGLAGFDYQRALDALFQEYPNQQTQSGKHYLNVGIPYFRQGDVTGWQPGGQIGDFSGFHINDDTDAFGKFVGAIGNSPIGTLLDIAVGGPAAAIPGGGLFEDYIPGFSQMPGGEMGEGGFGGPMPSDIIGGIGDLIGDGGTYDGPPRIPEGGFESIYDDIPTQPGEDIIGPGGPMDLPVLDRPGGGAPPPEPTPTPPTRDWDASDPRWKDVPVEEMPDDIRDERTRIFVEAVYEAMRDMTDEEREAIYERNPAARQKYEDMARERGDVPPPAPPGEPGDMPEAPSGPPGEPDPEDVGYDPGVLPDPTVPPVEGGYDPGVEPPEGEPGTPPEDDEPFPLPPIIFPPGDDDLPGPQPGPGPGDGYDPGVEEPGDGQPGLPGLPGGGGGGNDDDGGGMWEDIWDVIDPIGDIIWGGPPGHGWPGEFPWPGDGNWPGTPPWNPGGGGTGVGTGGTGVGTGGAGGAGGGGGSVGDINIDFGNIMDLIGLIGGGYLGWDQSKQDPQYPTMKDLYGGDYEGRMKNLRNLILGQTPESMLADLTPEQRAALDRMYGYGREGGIGGDILEQQLNQGQFGLGGLLGTGNYLNQLRESGGPQFQYDQGTFDTTMQNLMPGLEGTYLDMTRDLFRNLNEQQLPGIQMGAAGSGNLASSRAGVAEGIATRGALDRAGDIESQLMQNALNQAQRAAMTGGSGNLGADLRSQGDILGGYRNLAQLGLPGLGEAYRTGIGNIDMLMRGGNFQQAFDQKYLDRQRDLLAWQIPLINRTTPGGVGVPSAYPMGNTLQDIYQGINLGTGMSDILQRYNPWSTAGNAAPGGTV